MNKLWSAWKNMSWDELKNKLSELSGLLCRLNRGDLLITEGKKKSKEEYKKLKELLNIKIKWIFLFNYWKILDNLETIELIENIFGYDKSSLLKIIKILEKIIQNSILEIISINSERLIDEASVKKIQETNKISLLNALWDLYNEITENIGDTIMEIINKINEIINMVEERNYKEKMIKNRADRERIMEELMEIIGRQRYLDQRHLI